MKKSIITTTAAALTLSAALTLTAHADSVLYTFTGAATGAPDTQPASFTAGNFGIGNSNGTVGSPINATSASTGYTQVNGSAASGTNNLGNAVFTGAFASTSSYYTLTLTASVGTQVQLSDFDFGTRSTSTGPQAYALYTSADNFATSLFTGTIGNNSTWVFDNNTIPAPVTSTNGTLEVRLYTYGGAGNAAVNTENSRIDDITVTASAIAVPEPVTYAYVIAGLGALVLGMRRRSVA